MDLDLFILALIAVVGLACQWLAWRARLPAILFLLLAGLLLGPVTHLLQPELLFGEVLFPFVSLSVAIILFEGSLTLKFSELRDIGSVVRNMVTFGALINAAITTCATHFLVGLAWPLAALFGALMVVTGPTVIVPLLRTVKPNARIAKTLRWEGIVIDPVGALFAVVVFEWIIAQQSGTGLAYISWMFIQTIGAGLLLGVAMGYLTGVVLRQHLLPEYLHNFGALAVVCGTFALSESLYHESGLLAVTVMGMWLANMKGVDTREILNFKESLTVVLVSSLFIILAAMVDFSAYANLGYSAILVLLSVQLLSRPIKVFFCTWGSLLSTPERLLIAWIGPRGIVAAAVTSLFALKLEKMEFAQSELLVPLAFAVIMGTVIIQSATARAFALALKVAEPDSRGYLIVGGNPVARAIAEALQSADYRVMLCDTLWDNISTARMKNIPCYFGSPLSDHADRHLDLVGLGGMLGLSHHPDRNNLAVTKYRHEFGANQVLSLASRDDSSEKNAKLGVSTAARGLILFGIDITYGKLSNMINQGAKIKSTTLTDEFGFESWLSQNQTSILLFALDAKAQLHWFTENHKLAPKSGWQLFYLLPEAEQNSLAKLKQDKAKKKAKKAEAQAASAPEPAALEPVLQAALDIGSQAENQRE